MRTAATRPRQLWPFVLIGLVIIGAIIAALTVYGPWRSSEPTATPTGTPVPTTTGVDDIDPTGCLGGSERDAAMVIAAQDEAPHTSGGAIEVATAFVRWLNQYPYPRASDIDQIEKTALAADAPTKDVAAFFASEPNLSGGLVPDRTEYYLSTVPGVYNLESVADDSVTASIGTALVIEGAMSPTLKGSITVTMQWQDDKWKFVSSEGTRTTEDLYSIGLPFTGGC